MKRKNAKTTMMALSVFERIHFESILPQNGTVAEMDLAVSLTKRVNFLPKEIEEYGIVNLPDGRTAWIDKKAKSREFSFESYEMLFIQQGARKLEELKLVARYNKDLVKRFLAIVIK